LLIAVGGPCRRLHLTDVARLVDLLVRLGESKRKGAVLNVVDERQQTQRAYISEAKRLLGSRWMTLYVPFPFVRLVAGAAAVALRLLHGRKMSIGYRLRAMQRSASVRYGTHSMSEFLSSDAPDAEGSGPTADPQA
jgi:hypothetical protein